MKLQTSEEKVKPFRLVKYFTLTSLIVIFIGTLVLAVLNTHWAREMQREKSIDYALLLVENLNHQVFLQFQIPVMLKFGKIQLSNPEQFERLDKVVRNTLHSFKVNRVNIYGMNEDIIAYSFDKKLIGKKNVGGTGYQKAVSGQSTSKLLQRGNFWEILLGFPKDIKIVTFAPLRVEMPLSKISEEVTGIVEIVQDLSADYQTIFRFQIFVIVTSALVMSLLFLVLIFVVKRGEGIIERRALERLKLKEQLSRSEHLSSLGEMVAGISHEIRNPLGIIRSSAELLKKKMDGFNVSSSIPNIIVEEASRLNNIITDFLNYAKPKSPHLVPCRVEEIFEKNIAFLASQIEEQDFLIERSYENDPPEIMGDSDMLYQAFLNILINAMQAMPGGGKIKVQSKVNANFVSLMIEDEGEGIPRDCLEKIWDPFFTTKEKGTGLGLKIVKNIIESHGGRINIDNMPKRGARVTLELPIRRRK
jgi:signal transduction histidine kinase